MSCPACNKPLLYDDKRAICVHCHEVWTRRELDLINARR